MYYDDDVRYYIPTPICISHNKKCQFFNRSNPKSQICMLVVDYLKNPDFDFNKIAVSKSEKRSIKYLLELSGSSFRKKFLKGLGGKNDAGTDGH